MKIIVRAGLVKGFAEFANDRFLSVADLQFNSGLFEDLERESLIAPELL